MTDRTDLYRKISNAMSSLREATQFALLCDIAENPTVDFYRLKFAEFLEDEGERDWPELIRTEIEWLKTPTMELASRNINLIEYHLMPFGLMNARDSLKWDRGFITSVSYEVGSKIDEAIRFSLSLYHPIHTIRLLDWSGIEASLPPREMVPFLRRLELPSSISYVSIALEGIFEIPKEVDSIFEAGDVVYFNGELATNTPTGEDPIGYATGSDHLADNVVVARIATPSRQWRNHRLNTATEVGMIGKMYPGVDVAFWDSNFSDWRPMPTPPYNYADWSFRPTSNLEPGEYFQDYIAGLSQGEATISGRWDTPISLSPE